MSVGSGAQARPAPGVLDLGIGHPGPDLLPAGIVRAAIGPALDHAESALQYGAERGAPAFREALARFLTDETGVTTGPDRLLATSGASQALDLICTLFTEPGDVVAVEDPTYFLARKVFADHRLEVASVPVDEGGVVLDALAEVLEGRRPKLFYTVPYFQNPSGATLDAGRRARLLDLAREHGTRIVADEVYQLLAYDRAPPPSLAVGDAPVLALGSFSKILAPGLRLGWIQGPPDLLARIEGAGLLQSGGGLNPFASAVVGAALASGAVAAHVARLRRTYRGRSVALLAALREGARDGAPIELDAAPGDAAAGGYFVWARFPGLDAAAALPAVRAGGVAYQPGARFSSRGGSSEHARLCFAYYGEEALRDAGARLVAALVRLGGAQTGVL